MRVPLRTLCLSLVLPSLSFAAGGDDFRGSAQKGLTFLGNDTVRWQKSNNCYGCHVQAVTLEGLSVGKHNQYAIAPDVMKEVLRGILDTPGGAHTPGGLTHSGYPRTAKIFGASAFARYDALVDQKLTDDLLTLTRELIAFQQQDGSVQGDHQSYPVTAGTMQSTFQAAQAWRQAYARTADDAWLAPLRGTEKYIAAKAKEWTKNSEGVYLQDLNYAAMGLLAAGVPPSDDAVSALLKIIQKRQHQDGGWGFDAASNALATGQTVYTLKLAGLTEQDSVVRRGLGWLSEHQSASGGWSSSGAERAEAMWAVLGLVSVDVISLAITGVTDGERVNASMPITLTAKDNTGAAVKSLELRVDDVVVKKVDGGALDFTWNTSGLSSGKHTLDAVAVNAKGTSSRRRVEVYAGNVFLTEFGTRFTNEGTQVTMRDIAPDALGGAVKLEVSTEAGKSVFTQKLPSRHGALAFVFGGKGADGKPFIAGRYKAVLSFLNEKGEALQIEPLVFVHDSLEAQQARYAEVQGRLDLARDGAGAANAEVELVDDLGNVVQRTRSNADGQYRFKSLDSGKYKVRVKKDGFKAEEAAVDAKAGAAPAAASISIH